MALGLWAVFIFAVEKGAQKFAKWRNIIKGKPSVVIEKGKINIKEKKRNMLEAEQVRTLYTYARDIFNYQSGIRNS